MLVSLIVGAFRYEQLRADRALVAERESRFRTALLQLQQVRTGPHENGWTDRAAFLLRDAVKLHGPGPEIQTQAAGTRQGLDAKRTRSFPDFGARFLAFDGEGKRLAIGGATDPLDAKKPRPTQIWELGSSAPIATPVTAPGPVGFRPDGTTIQLAPGTDGKHLEVLELKRGTPLRRVDLPGPLARDEFEEPPLALAMTPDGSHVAATIVRPDGSSAVAVWDGSAGKPGREFAFAARCLAFSADGSFVAGGTADGTVTIWSAATGEAIANLDCGRSRLHAIAFGAEPRRFRPASPRPPGAGWLLAAANAGGTVTVWDVASHKLLATCRGNSFEVLSVAFSPDSTLLASAGRLESGVRLWEARTGTLLLQIEAEADLCHGLAFSPDGRSLVVANLKKFGPGHVRVWALDDSRGLRSLYGLESRVVKVVVSPDSRLLAGLATDWTLALWDASTGRLLHLLEVPRGFSPDNAGLAFSPDGRRFAFSTGTEAVLWELDSGRELASWRLLPGLNDAIAFHGPDQLLLLRTEARDNVIPFGPNRPPDHPRVIRLRDMLGREPLRPVREIDDLPWTVNENAATIDGRFFVVVTADTTDHERGRLLIIEGSTGRILTQTDIPRRSWGLDPSGRVLADSDGDHHTRFLAMPSLTYLGDVPVVADLVSPDAGLGIVSPHFVSDELAHLVIGLDTGMPLVRIPSGTLASSYRDAFSPDGRFVAWGNPDGTVIVCLPETIRLKLDDFGLGW